MDVIRCQIKFRYTFSSYVASDSYTRCLRWTVYLELVSSFFFRYSDAAFMPLSIIYRNPVYHQMVFATLVISSAARVNYLLKRSQLTSSMPAKAKSVVGKLFSTGAALFVFGFLIWNLDNIYCDTLTRWKVSVGWPLAFFLEGMSDTFHFRDVIKTLIGHSWWHIFTVSSVELQAYPGILS